MLSEYFKSLQFFKVIPAARIPFLASKTTYFTGVIGTGESAVFAAKKLYFTAFSKLAENRRTVLWMLPTEL